MIRLFSLTIIIFNLLGCTNSADFQKGEIEMISVLRDLLKKESASDNFIDARKVVTREKIDASGIAVLFVEFESGRNGTSIKFPGANVGEVWLGVDGTTITMKKGFVIATRGLGNDLMSSTGEFPVLNEISDGATYSKTMNWLFADNQIQSKIFSCTISVESDKRTIIVFDKEFLTRRAVETCQSEILDFQNEYFFEDNGIVRRSHQFHSGSIGRLLIERLD